MQDGTCENIDDCTENSHECDSNARCTDEIGGHKCTCQNGYYGPGTLCLRSDSCLGNQCGFGMCINESKVFKSGEVPPYACSCFNGYEIKFEIGTIDGPCQDVDECLRETACAQFVTRQ